MLSKNKLKYLRSLQLKKYRQKYNKFVVEGDKMVRELCEQQPQWITELYAIAEWIEQFPQAQHPYTLATSISSKDLQRISAMKTPNQVLAVVEPPPFSLPLEGQLGQLSLFLDGIQDPGNLGTILRIADWFAIPYIFCSPDTVEVYNPKVIQASMGAFFRVSVIPITATEFCQKYPSFTVYGTFMEGQNVFQVDIASKSLIIIGNEGQGIRPETEAVVQKKIGIPKGKGSNAESLNAGVATGIVCAAFLRN